MALSIQDELEWMSCCSCGVAFAASAAFWKGRRANQEAFFCPNGHEQSFKESTEDQLQRDLMLRTQERDSARVGRDAAQARVDKYWRALNRLKKSAAAK